MIAEHDPIIPEHWTPASSCPTMRAVTVAVPRLLMSPGALFSVRLTYWSRGPPHVAVIIGATALGNVDLVQTSPRFHDCAAEGWGLGRLSAHG